MVNEEEISEGIKALQKSSNSTEAIDQEISVSSEWAQISFLLTDNLIEIFNKLTFSNKFMSALLILSMAVDNSRANVTALSARFVTDTSPFFS